MQRVPGRNKSFKEKSGFYNLKLEVEIRQIDDEKRGLAYDNSNLKTFPIYSKPEDGPANIPDSISDLLEEVISETLAPRQSLLAISRLFPTRIEVLDSARIANDGEPKHARNDRISVKGLIRGMRWAASSTAWQWL